MEVDVAGWLAELPLIREYYEQFGSALPELLLTQLDGMKARLESAEG